MPRILISRLILRSFKGSPEDFKKMTAQAYGFDLTRPWTERVDHQLDCIVLEQDKEEEPCPA